MIPFNIHHIPVYKGNKSIQETCKIKLSANYISRIIRFVGFSLILLYPLVFACSQPLKLVNLKCDNRISPLGIDNKQPAFSWQITSDKRSVIQTAYRIIVTDNPDDLNSNKGNIWDSKRIESDRSINIFYSGPELEPAHYYYWKVMVWVDNGKISQWSEPASFQMGLLKPEDWGNARWIGMEELPESMRVLPGVHGGGDNLAHKALQRPVLPLLRKEFEVRHEIESATLFISGLGQYEAYINGVPVSKTLLTPGWTDYDKTVLYNTFDITSDLKPGANVIGALVGTGFYHINRERYRKLVIVYGNPKLICKIRLKYRNGETDEIVSDASWVTLPSPVLYSSVYGGEDYDARLEVPKWNEPGIDETCWKKVQLVSAPSGTLKSEMDFPITIHKEISVKNITKLADGKYLFDFGQNASGIPEIKVKGKRGQVIRLIPAELISNTKEANQTATGRGYYYTYTLKGEGVEIWKPKFTYYGFRYIQVEGAVPDTTNHPVDLAELQEIKFYHICNSSPSNGTFECSNDLFNRTFSLIDWAIRSNMQSVLTDCPHREKLGWLEQSFLMGASINYNYEIFNLYRKIVADMMDAQTSEGLIPDIAPEYVTFDGGFRDSPEWGSASVILPYLLYKWYGDIKTMETAWPMMIKYAGYLSKMAKDNILSYGLGDWFDLGPQRPGFAQLTPVEVTATAIYYYDLKLISEMAGLLNKNGDKELFTRKAEEVKKAFNKKFFNPVTGVYSTGSQTAMSMPLCLGLAEPQYHEIIIKNLTNSIVKNKKALTAGDIGFHYLVEALTNNGQSQLLYDMNNRDDVPGYGFQLKKGATALTESWSALENVSNNHLMLGHLMEWFYNGVGGIRQSESSVAFKNIIIKPAITRELNSARTSFNSPYGTIATDWKIDQSTLFFNALIPCNTNALVYLPLSGRKTILEGGKPVTQNPDIKFIKNEGVFAVYQVGSGFYNFIVQ